MKKTLMIWGIMLFIMAAVCLCAAWLYHRLYAGVMDGSAQMYANMLRKRNIFLIAGGIMAVGGILLLAISSGLHYSA